MKTVPSLLQAYLDGGGNILFRGDLFTFTLADGVTIYRWSTVGMNVTIGGNTWISSGKNAPIVRRTGFSNSKLPTIDQMMVTLIGGSEFTINGQSLTMLASTGYFDAARMQVDHLMGPDLPTALSWGPILSAFEGYAGEVAPNNGELVMTVNTEPIKLNKTRPLRPLTAGCPYAVYDKNCDPGQTLLAAKTLSGAASGTPTTVKIPTISAALTAKAAGYFNLGFLIFTSGALNGQIFDVDTWDGTNFFMAAPMPSAPAAADTFHVNPGCDQSFNNCAVKFANAGVNGHYGGFDHIPTPEAA